MPKTAAPVASPSRTRQFPAVKRKALTTLQVNLGYRCNQACTHCHVDAGPNREEAMTAHTLNDVFCFARRHDIKTIDFTGGAPELNPHFTDAVIEARSMGAEVIDRCNLTILNEPGQERLSAFLATNDVHVIASLPCYSADNVDAQRGNGVYERSLEGIRRLNAEGYGQPGSGLRLDFVFNPQGARLPGPGAVLERDYKRELGKLGLSFNRLLTITNMPIRRFRHALMRENRFYEYMDLLVSNHNPANVDALMCRSLLSVDWQGYVYDCDFNQMLGMGIGGGGTHITELDADLVATDVAVAEHCYGCSAGAGSSCGGALSG